MTRTLFPIIILFTCLVSACVENDVKHVSRQKMTGIMTDIYLAEAYSSVVFDSTGMSANKNKDSLALYYKSVLNHHGVSLDEFSNSLRWYSSHPEEMDSMYINVLTELSTMEGLVNAASAN